MRPRLPPGTLSQRQAEVLTLALAGKSHAEIAATLGISPHTVLAHVREIRIRTESRGRNWLQLLRLRLAAERVEAG